MSDKKGLYSPLPETEHEDDLNNRPPPYTPSTAPNSPFVAPHQTPNAAASSSSATAPPMPGQTSSLYPPLNYAGPHNPQHIPNYHSAGHSPNPAYPANPPHPASFSVTNTPQQAYPSYQATGYSPLPADHSKPPPPLPNPGQTSNTVPQVVHVRTPIRVEELKSKPNIVVCQHCRHLVLTETTPENGSCTYLGILGLILVGVTSCGCCLLPLCMTSCKDIMHSCPNCHEDIGLYSRIKERTYPVRVEH